MRRLILHLLIALFTFACDTAPSALLHSLLAPPAEEATIPTVVTPTEFPKPVNIVTDLPLCGCIQSYPVSGGAGTIQPAPVGQPITGGVNNCKAIILPKPSYPAMARAAHVAGTGGIQPQFDVADEFHEGYAAVKIGGKWGFIDRTGRIIVQPKYDAAAGFFEGLGIIISKNKAGYVDKTGEVVIQPQFDFGVWFKERLAPVVIGEKWGFIDKTGALAMSTQIDKPEVGLCR